jgi:hypothetical protein
MLVAPILQILRLAGNKPQFFVKMIGFAKKLITFVYQNTNLTYGTIIIFRVLE